VETIGKQWRARVQKTKVGYRERIDGVREADEMTGRAADCVARSNNKTSRATKTPATRRVALDDGKR